MVFNFKRILSKIPLVKSKLGTYAAALFLLKEHMKEDEYNLLVEYISETGKFDELTKNINKLTLTEALCLLEEENMTKDISEDAPTNNIGDGHIAKKDNVMKFDGRSKNFKSVMKRIKERKLKEQEKLLKARLLHFGIKEEVVNEEEYEAFFKKAMKKFKIKDVEDLSDKERVKFFNWVDKNWDAGKNETD
jgi:hypothetical protein